MTRWLLKHEFPATEPLDILQPIELGDYTVTFWAYYSQRMADPPSVVDLGHLLRQLHALPPAPIDLPQYEPLVGLMSAVEASSWLPGREQTWIVNRCGVLLDRYQQLDFVLPPGHLHGDAYPGNLLRDRERVVLGDWDETAVGPRELDLVNTFQGVRYGRSAADLRNFSRAYGYDLATWPGVETLREIRDLHTLGPFIRRADDGDAAAADQLAHRLGTLNRASDEPWTPAI